MDAQKLENQRTPSGRLHLVHWFCAYCGLWFFAPPGQDPEQCPTKGCARPFGFGAKSRVRRSETH